MFGRQWFSGNDQLGLLPDSLHFEYLVASHLFKDAMDLMLKSHQLPKSYRKRLYHRAHYLLLRKNSAISSNIVYYYFNNFWPDMNTIDCQILDFFKSAAPELNFVPAKISSKADIIFETCYSSHLPLDVTNAEC